MSVLYNDSTTLFIPRRRSKKNTLKLRQRIINYRIPSNRIRGFNYLTTIFAAGLIGNLLNKTAGSIRKRVLIEGGSY